MKPRTLILALGFTAIAAYSFGQVVPLIDPIPQPTLTGIDLDDMTMTVSVPYLDPNDAEVGQTLISTVVCNQFGPGKEAACKEAGIAILIINDKIVDPNTP